MNVIIYFAIGLVVAFINNMLWARLYKFDMANKNEDNPGMIIVLLAWVILWPFGLINMASMIHEMIRKKNGENSQ